MISAKIIADSLSPQGHRLTTLEVVMPRYILAEFNTHRVLSKNSASSRAIPFNKMVKNVQDNPFIPYAWQKDHSGMQGNEYFTNEFDIHYHNSCWETSMNLAIEQAKALNDKGNGVSKQLCNRLLEPFMYHKVLVSGTEWENFFNLRCPQYTIKVSEKDKEDREESFKSWKDLLKFTLGGSEKSQNATRLDKLSINKGQADIHMMFLAEAIYDAMNESTPKNLKEGEWHIPYGDNFDEIELAKLSGYWAPGIVSSEFEDANKSINILKCKISIARCARLSYQTLGDNPVIDYEKDLQLYDVLSKSGHWSPFEHVAKVMNNHQYENMLNGSINGDERGIPNKAKGWCRNFRGFIQQRALID